MKPISTALGFVALVLTTGWLMLSEQAGSPLSASEFTQQIGRLGRQVLDEPEPPTVVSQASTPYAELERKVHDQINQYRAEQGLSPLTLNAEISEQARLHSEAMASGRVPFSHQGFDQRVRSIARTIPYRQAGENVAYNQGFSDPVTQAVEGWIDSPGHHENIVGNFDLTGVGITRTADGKYYLTQIFVRRLL